MGCGCGGFVGRGVGVSCPDNPVGHSRAGGRGAPPSWPPLALLEQSVCEHPSALCAPMPRSRPCTRLSEPVPLLWPGYFSCSLSTHASPRSPSRSFSYSVSLTLSPIHALSLSPPHYLLCPLVSSPWLHPPSLPLSLFAFPFQKPLSLSHSFSPLPLSLPSSLAPFLPRLGWTVGGWVWLRLWVSNALPGEGIHHPPHPPNWSEREQWGLMGGVGG